MEFICGIEAVENVLLLFRIAKVGLGTMLIILLGVYLQNRAVERAADLLRAEINQLRAEIKHELAELELRLTKQILELSIV